jgi:uncharacterized protein YacL
MSPTVRATRRTGLTLDVESVGNALRPILRSGPHCIPIKDWVGMMYEICDLPEEGGTVGPLRDGTLIVVEREEES